MVAIYESGSSVRFQAPAFICLDNNASICSAGEDTEIDPSSTKAMPTLIFKVMLVQYLLMK